MGRLYSSITAEERAVIDLVLLHAKSVLVEGEDVQIDPEPSWSAGEQYHFYYHCPGSKYATMAGWFRVDGKIINLTTFTDMRLVTNQYDPGADTTKLVYHKVDVSDPNADSLKKILRREFDEAQKHLLREAKSGE